MKVVSRFIITIFSISMFIAALVVNISATNQILDYQSVVKSTTSDNSVVSENQPSSDSSNIISYAELCGRLMVPLEYNISVNGTEYTATKGYYANIDFASIPKTNYSFSVEYNADSTIKKIVYRSK